MLCCTTARHEIVSTVLYGFGCEPSRRRRTNANCSQVASSFVLLTDCNLGLRSTRPTRSTAQFVYTGIEIYTWPGSSWRPSAREADVIAARPQVHLVHQNQKPLNVFNCNREEEPIENIQSQPGCPPRAEGCSMAPALQKSGAKLIYVQWTCGLQKQEPHTLHEQHGHPGQQEHEVHELQQNNKNTSTYKQ